VELWTVQDAALARGLAAHGAPGAPGGVLSDPAARVTDPVARARGRPRRS
jgi:hypothetical protein